MNYWGDLKDPSFNSGPATPFISSISSLEWIQRIIVSELRQIKIQSLPIFIHFDEK